MARALFLLVFLSSALIGQAAQADCYAGYKAKQDDPLRLHYGVMTVEAMPCVSSPEIDADVSRRLEDAGWILLQIESVFEGAALETKKADAGEFFLRF